MKNFSDLEVGDEIKCIRTIYKYSDYFWKGNNYKIIKTGGTKKRYIVVIDDQENEHKICSNNFYSSEIWDTNL